MLLNSSFVTTMKSTTGIPRRVPASCKRWLSTASSSLGVGSPLGWLWAMMTAAALARIAAMKTSRGWTKQAVNVPWAISAIPVTRFRESSSRATTLSDAPALSRSFTISHASCAVLTSFARYLPLASRTSITRTWSTGYFGEFSKGSSTECVFKSLVLWSVHFWDRMHALHDPQSKRNIISDTELVVHPAGTDDVVVRRAVMAGHQPYRSCDDRRIIAFSDRAIELLVKLWVVVRDEVDVSSDSPRTGRGTASRSQAGGGTR